MVKSTEAGEAENEGRGKESEESREIENEGSKKAGTREGEKKSKIAVSACLLIEVNQVWRGICLTKTIGSTELKMIL
jgi:hypothetical protein